MNNDDTALLILAYAAGVYLLTLFGCVAVVKAYEAGLNEGKKQTSRKVILRHPYFRPDTVESLN